MQYYEVWVKYKDQDWRLVPGCGILESLRMAEATLARLVQLNNVENVQIEDSVGAVIRHVSGPASFRK